MGLFSVDNAKVTRGVRRSATTKKNGITISGCGRDGASGHSRRNRTDPNPLRSILLEAGDRERPPRVDLAIGEEDVGWVHIPSAVTVDESRDVGLRGDRTLWKSAQTTFLEVLLTQELRLDASVVVRTSTLEETCTRAFN